MGNSEKRVNPDNNNPRRRMVELRDSYDTIPQPTGKFKDLFQQVQAKQKADDSPSNVKHKPSK